MGIGRRRPGTCRAGGGASPVGARPLVRVGMAHPSARARRTHLGGRGGWGAVRVRPLQANRRGGRGHHAGDRTRSPAAGSGAHAGRIRLSATVAGRGIDGLPRGRRGQRPRADAVRGLRVRPGRDPPQLLPNPIRTRTRACHEEGTCRRPHRAGCAAIKVRCAVRTGSAIDRFRVRMIGRTLPSGKHVDGNADTGHGAMKARDRVPGGVAAGGEPGACVAACPTAARHGPTNRRDSRLACPGGESTPPAKAPPIPGTDGRAALRAQGRTETLPGKGRSRILRTNRPKVRATGKPE